MASSDIAYLGIDPGSKGGIALLRSDNAPRFTTMPQTEKKVWSWLESLVQNANRNNYVIRAVIEQVGGYVGKQKAEAGHQPGSHMFNFGMGYGGLRMALIALGMREGHEWHAVHPRTWQAPLGIEKTPKTILAASKQPYHKLMLKCRAEQLFPYLVVTDSTADALLLAYYAANHQQWE